MPSSPHRTQHKKASFLDAYSKIGTIHGACQQVGMERSTHYKWLKRDRSYAENFRTAEEQAIERMEHEARRRALVGTEKPVYQGGKLVGTVREFSDTLMIFLLKAARPEKYRERYETQVTGSRGGPLEMKVTFGGRYKP